MGVSFYKGEAASYSPRLPQQQSGNSFEIFTGHVLAVSYEEQSLGAILVKLIDVDKKSEDKITRIALPADLNIIKYPLPGELVFLFNGIGSFTLKNRIGSQLFYLNNITANNSIAFNSNPYFSTLKTTKTIQAATDNGYEVRFENRLKNLKSFKKPWPSNEVNEKQPLKSFEGDFLLQGRLGSSIRLGSTIVQADNNPWSNKGGINGDAITVISVSKAKGDTSRLEDVNKDDASIYLCQSQTIPIILSTSRELRSLKYVYDVKDGATTILTDYTTYLDTPLEEIQYQDSGAGTGNKKTDLSKIPTPPAEVTPEELQQLLNSIKDEDLEYLEAIGDSKPTNRRGTVITLARVDGQFIEKTAAKALLLLKKAAQAAGFGSLYMTSGYRPGFGKSPIPVRSNKGVDYKLTPQELLRRERDRWVNRYAGKYADWTDEEFIFSAPSSKYDPLTAPPGASPHNDGVAADLNTGSRTTPSFGPLKESMYIWLVKNSYKFGFVRTVPTEEWHFEYRPQSALKGPYGGFPKLITNAAGRNGLQFYKDLGLDKLT